MATGRCAAGAARPEAGQILPSLGQARATCTVQEDCTALASPPLSWSREGPWAALRQAAPAPSGLLTLSETEPVDDDACSRCLPITKHRTGLCPVASHSIARGRGQQVNSQRCGLRAPAMRPPCTDARRCARSWPCGGSSPELSIGMGTHATYGTVCRQAQGLKQDVMSTSSVTYALVLHMNHLWKLQQGHVIGWRSPSIHNYHRMAILVSWTVSF